MRVEVSSPRLLGQARSVDLDFRIRSKTGDFKRRDTEHLTPGIEATFYHAGSHLRKLYAQVSAMLNLESFVAARLKHQLKRVRFCQEKRTLLIL
jgi:hypothetical protein